jgi:hypothetical protein
MCDPLSLASFAIGTASSIAGQIQQQGLYEQNEANAMAAFRNNQVATNRRAAQEMDAAAAEKFDTSLDARKAVATQKVAAGESGVSGLSIEGLLRDFAGTKARHHDRVDQNLDWTLGQLEAEKRGQAFQTVDRINSVQRPSFAGLGLKIAGAGFDSVSSYRATKAATPKAAKAAPKV